MKEKELEIITHGKVCIENMSEAEQHSFYMEMLVKILELYRGEVSPDPIKQTRKTN